MKKIDKIRLMSIEDLAKFLICESIEEDVDYDYDEEAYITTNMCYVTPFCTYPHWYDYDDVLEDTIAKLKEEKDDEVNR